MSDIDIQSQTNSTVFIDRIGSFFVYEANNATKQFKVQTHLNLTNCYAGIYFPHFVYTSLLRSAGGQPKLNFDLTIKSFPNNPRTKEYEYEASGVFLCFVAGIGLAMIPASIVSKVVNERESEVKHI